MDKQCIGCKETKAIDNFGLDKRRKDGHNRYCKKCVCEFAISYRERNKEKIADSLKKYRETHKEQRNLANKTWREKNIDHVKKYSKEYNSKNFEKRKLAFNAWVEKNPERMRELKKNNREKNKLIERERKLKRFYNMTLEDYDNLMASQNSKCKICSKDAADERNKNLVIDHCHDSGKVRSLLCDRCNRTLGVLEENVDLMMKMMQYIKQHEHLKKQPVEKHSLTQ